MTFVKNKTTTILNLLTLKSRQTENITRGHTLKSRDSSSAFPSASFDVSIHTSVTLPAQLTTASPTPLVASHPLPPGFLQASRIFQSLSIAPPLHNSGQQGAVLPVTVTSSPCGVHFFEFPQCTSGTRGTLMQPDAAL